MKRMISTYLGDKIRQIKKIGLSAKQWKRNRNISIKGNYFVCFMFLIVCLSGCKQSNTTTNIPKIDSITTLCDIAGEKMLINADIFFPRQMLMFNDTTIVISERKSEYAVNIFTIRKDSIVFTKGLGRIGNGPGDIVFGLTGIQKDTCNSCEGIWMSDIQSIKFHPYDTKTNTWEDRPLRIKKLHTGLVPCSNSFVLRDGILGSSTAFNSQIFMFYPEKDTLEGYDFYPLIPNPFDNLFSKNVYSGKINIKPDKSQAVLAYLLFKSVCIISLDKLSKPLFLKFKDTPFPELEVVDGKANMDVLRNLLLQYVDIYTTDKFIYLLYANKSNKELENHSSEALDEGMSVHVFKWDGSAQGSMDLDRIISCFCVDEENGIIYGIDPTEEDNGVLYRFRIPENIRNKIIKTHNK